MRQGLPEGAYVYALKENGTIFYIGKGHGNRYMSHFECIRKDRECGHGPCNYIREAQLDGEIITSHILKDGMEDAEAYELEHQLIDKAREMGLPIINLVDKGPGVYGYKWTPDQRAARREQFKELKDAGKLDHFIYSNIGRKETEEQKIKRSQSIRTAWEDPDLKQKQSKVVKKWMSDPEKKQRHLDGVRSDDARKKNSESHKGKTSRAKTWPGLIAPDGTIHAPIYNLNAFCVDHHLSYHGIWYVVKGRNTDYNGWKVLSDTVSFQ